MDRPTDAGGVRRRRRRHGARRHALPFDPVLKEWTAEKAALIAELPPKQRDALTLSFHGNEPAQIAEIVGRSVKAVSMELYRARKRVRLALEDKGRLLLLLLPARLRRAATRASGSLAGSPVPQSLANGLMPLLASVLVSVGTPFSLPAVLPLPTPTAYLGGATNSPAAVSSPFHGAVSPYRLAAEAGSGGSLPTSLGATRAPNPLGGHLPADATPDDTQFLTAASAPRAATSRAPVVALGMSSACSCSVLFASFDGGSTWAPSSVPAPPDAEQVVLPPGWPTADSRIFIGTNTVTGLAPYVVPHFGAIPEPLAAPPGHLALSSRFDQGDDRLFVAAQGEVAVVNLDSGLSAAPLITYPASVGVASLATPPSSEGHDVLILAPPGTALTVQPLSGPTQGRSVVRCRGTVCTLDAATPPPSATQITTDPAGPLTSVFWAQGVSLSPAAGGPFKDGPLPPGTSGVDVVSLQGDAVWAIVTRATTTAVVRIETGGAQWSAHVLAGNPLLARTFLLVPVGTGHVLALLTGGGFLCSADAGLSWQTRCS